MLSRIILVLFEEKCRVLDLTVIMTQCYARKNTIYIIHFLRILLLLFKDHLLFPMLCLYHCHGNNFIFDYLLTSVPEILHYKIKQKMYFCIFTMLSFLMKRYTVYRG